MTSTPPRIHTASQGPLHRPLSHILGTRAKVGALRILSSRAAPLTQRQLARQAGVQHRSIQQALEHLVALGVVLRIEGGRDFLVSLNPQHHLSVVLQDLFRAERTLFAELRRRLVEVVATRGKDPGVRSVVLFGSAARAEELIGSDLDVLVIAATKTAAEDRLERLLEERDRLRKIYGVRVNPIAYDLTTARRRWRQKLPPLPEVVRDGVVLLGPPLVELLRG